MAKSLNDKINIRGEVDQWAKFAIERFQKQLDAKKIGKTGALRKSFARHINASGGEVQSVMITFNMYGRYRDMGVGRGLKAYERSTNKMKQVAVKDYGAELDYVHRGPKRWFNKPKMAQIYKLREILAGSIGDSVVQNVQDEFSEYTNYRVNL